MTCGECQAVRDERVRAKAQRRAEQAEARRARAARENAQEAQSKTDWPVVIRRIERVSGPRTAALFVESLNSHRRRQGLAEVVL